MAADRAHPRLLPWPTRARAAAGAGPSQGGPERDARRWRGVGVVLAALLVALGCSGIGVKPGDMESLVASIEYSLNQNEELSPRSLQTLRQLDLEGVYRRRPFEAFAKLQPLVGDPAPPDMLFALSELAYTLGYKSEREKQPFAMRYYYLAAGYAYHYLFDPLQAQSERCSRPELQSARQLPVDCMDPRFRIACELYNASLSKCLRAAQQQGLLDCRHGFRVATPDGGEFTLNVSHRGFRWSNLEFGPMRFCSDYRVVGLPNQHRSFGVGVPLMVERVAPPGAAWDCRYPEGLTFPVTAFFRFEGSLAELGQHRCGRLELFNPLTLDAVDVGGWLIPLETDLTTPVAYFLARSDLDAIAYLGFSFVEKVQQRAGIYFSQPYEPGKIPVVFVHGLLSSPITWAPMVNDLTADPALRSRYQFWYYLYPTGNPYLATAADLRARLRLLRQEIDPNRADAALDQMVLVGHSMGGLVSKLLTLDSSDAFWSLASDRPFEESGLSPESQAELRPVFFFERVPEVKRVVYLATPHNGSELSPSFLGKLGRKLIRLPLKFQDDMQQLITHNPQYRLGSTPQMLPTSIDLLAPGNPALRTLAALPKPGDVTCHTVAGIVSKRDPFSLFLRGLGIEERCGDGVVPYESAHTKDAVSELIVEADHMRVHHHPRAIEEVRQILHEHWRQAMKP